jgi:GDP-L-fucose synthase
MADACIYLMERINFKDIINSQLNLTPNTQHLAPVEVRNTHINIGTGVDVSIKELALIIKDIVGYNGELYFNDTKPDGTMVKLTDPSKLHSLGWRHKVELEDGITTMYKWYCASMDSASFMENLND